MLQTVSASSDFSNPMLQVSKFCHELQQMSLSHCLPHVDTNIKSITLFLENYLFKAILSHHTSKVEHLFTYPFPVKRSYKPRTTLTATAAHTSTCSI